MHAQDGTKPGQPGGRVGVVATVLEAAAECRVPVVCGGGPADVRAVREPLDDVLLLPQGSCFVAAWQTGFDDRG